MAIDATGTPTTNYNIPKFNTAADSPTGKGVNAMMDSIDGIIPFNKSLATTKGDLIVVTASGTYARMGVGSDGQALTADTASSGGVKWADAAAAPAGAIMAFGGAAAPTGYLLCNGSAVSRTTYAALFAAISTAYGVGDGSTTFNLPDLQGRIPVGKGTHTDVATLGNSDGVAVASRRPKHAHTVSDPGHTHSLTTNVAMITGNSYNVGTGSTLASTGAPGTTSAATGISVGQAGVTDAPAYQVVNYIIKT